MTLDKAIKLKFPKSGAARFTVWDELNRIRFNSEMYELGQFPKQLLNKPVTGISVSCGPGGCNSLMCINIYTGEKALKELLDTAYKLQSHCEQIMKDPKRNCHDCVFWDGHCVLRDEPAGWDIPIGGVEE